MLYHFGGKSGNAYAYSHAKGMDESLKVICRWFENRTIEIMERIEEG